jgi:transcriptional regulator GlxA family with amidase domain
MTEEKFFELCEWIDLQLGREISWPELTERSGANHIELQAAFAKYKGTTPMTWIRKRRKELRAPATVVKKPVELPQFLFKKV